MHVAMVPALAGTSTPYVLDLSEALAGVGVRVSVLARRDSPDLAETVEVGGARLRHLSAGPPAALPEDRLVAQLPRLADALERAWREERPDVVHAHSWMSGLAAVAAARGSRVPVVLTLNGLGRAEETGRVSAEQVIARRAERVVTTSEDELFELVGRGVPRRSVSTVPCGVDTELFGPNGPVTPRGDRPRLVTAGDGVEEVIAALAAVPAPELLVVGGDERLAELAEQVGVADRVRLLGPVDRVDLPAVYRSADAVVCAPRSDPHGSVALEAMACGRAVVATAVGGLRDAVVDRVTGVHVPPGDPIRLAQALRGLLADGAMPMAYGYAGRDRVESRYGWPRIAAATVAVYQDVLARRAAASAATGSGR